MQQQRIFCNHFRAGTCRYQSFLIISKILRGFKWFIKQMQDFLSRSLTFFEFGRKGRVPHGARSLKLDCQVQVDVTLLCISRYFHNGHSLPPGRDRPPPPGSSHHPRRRPASQGSVVNKLSWAHVPIWEINPFKLSSDIEWGVGDLNARGNPTVAKCETRNANKEIMTLFSQCHFPQRQDDGPTQDPISASLGLVNDANTIRENIVDEFTCEVRLSVPVSVSCWRISTFLEPSLQIIRFNFISDILFYFVKNNQTWMWAGPGVRLLRGRG